MTCSTAKTSRCSPGCRCSPVKGYDAAGIVSTVKHFPGHGTATTDSHDSLPLVDSSLDEDEEHDLPPFAAAIAKSAPAVMLSRLDLHRHRPRRPGEHGA